MSFRTTTTLTIALLTAVTLGAGFMAVSEAFNALQREQLDASLLGVAAAEALEAPAHHFSFSDRPGPAANDVGPLTKYGVIYDEQGKVLSATSPFDTAPLTLSELQRPLREAFDIHFEGSSMRGVLVPIPEHRGKVLFLATSREDLDGDEAFLHRAMLVAFIVAVGWVVAVAYWLGGRLTVAHDAVAETVRKITQGDLSARVRIEHSDAEVAQVAADINEMVDQLGKLLASQQRFIANAAHELRSPLATLHGELQQAVRKKRDAASYEQAIHSALTASRRLTRLVQDLLTLARVTSRNTDQAASVEVMAAIREARAEVAPFAAERGVTLDVDLDVSCTVPDRGGDTARLFRNLLENAIRHSPEHGTVHVVGTCSGNTILIRISDQGPGVPVADHEAVFEPFFRGKGATPGEGAGLGLGIAREIARSHRGDVILDRSNAIGAQFVVSLPVVLRVGLKT